MSFLTGVWKAYLADEETVRLFRELLVVHGPVRFVSTSASVSTFTSTSPSGPGTVNLHGMAFQMGWVEVSVEVDRNDHDANANANRGEVVTVEFPSPLHKAFWSAYLPGHGEPLGERFEGVRLREFVGMVLERLDVGKVGGILGLRGGSGDATRTGKSDGGGGRGNTGDTGTGSGASAHNALGGERESESRLRAEFYRAACELTDFRAVHLVPGFNTTTSTTSTTSTPHSTPTTLSTPPPCPNSTPPPTATPPTPPTRPNRPGRMDFYIDEKKWGIEILREDESVEEHLERVRERGGYHPWVGTGVLADYVVLDFWSKGRGVGREGEGKKKDAKEDAKEDGEKEDPGMWCFFWVRVGLWMLICWTFGLDVGHYHQVVFENDRFELREC